MLTIIKDANLDDVRRELKRMLNDGISSELVRDTATSVISLQPEPILAIFNFVKEHTEYVSDPEGKELFTSPARLIEKIKTGAKAPEDCDGLALLCASMLGSVGYKTRIAILATSGYEYDHAIAQVWSDSLGEWLNVDATSNLPLGWEIDYNRVEYITP